MIEMNKKYQTRDGRPVRILCVDGPGTQPVVGIVEDTDSVDTWDARGAWLDMHAGPSDWDLVPVPEKYEGWMPMVKQGDGFHWTNGAVHETKEEAVSYTSSKDITIAHVTWES